jgi:hypothetical protein
MRCIRAKRKVRWWGLPRSSLEPGSGFSLDCVVLDVAEWAEELQEKAREAREFGYFQSPRFTKWSEDEYPTKDEQRATDSRK